MPQYDLSVWLDTACLGSFPSGRGKKHPDPKSGGEVDPDKPECAMSWQGNVTNLKVLRIFLDFCHQSPTFQTDPRVIEPVDVFQYHTKRSHPIVTPP